MDTPISRPDNPALERAFEQERADALRVRSRWIWSGAIVVWVLSLLWFDLDVFPSRTFALQVRGPELLIAALFLVWVRKPRSRLAIEGCTVAAWGLISVVSSVALQVVPHDKLPAKVASLAFSVAAILVLGAYSWGATLAASLVLALSLSVLRYMGETQLYSMAATAFGFAFGMLVALAIARDRLKRAEFFSRQALVDANERLRREDEIRRRLFVNLSHDFRTPLAVIQGEASLLRGQHGAESAAALARIEGNAQSLTDLTEQLLDLARLDAGQMLRRARRCDLSAASRDVAALLSPVDPSRRLQACSVDPAPIALVDPGHLHRILVNLVANSLRHARGEVTVTVGSAGERATIEVSDDGDGIAPERRAVIFERFVSFREGIDTASGIGLPLARELAALNGGSLELVDGAPRTTFRLALPACEGPADAPDRPSLISIQSPALPPEPPVSPTAPRVLVVEDNPDMAALLRRVLQGPFRVEVVGAVQPGVERVKEGGFCAVLCDVMLPDGTGYDLLSAVRASQGLDAPPVLLVSALAEVEQRVRGLAAGADDYIAKPFAPDELRGRVVAAVERAAQRRRALDQQRDSLLMEIHDGISASLTRAAMLLDARSLGRAPEPTLAPVLGAIRDGLDEVRTISGILAPRACDWASLTADIRRATADACAAASISLDFDADAHAPQAIVPVAVAHTLRRVAREVTTNMLKHAGARALSCRLRSHDGWSLHMEDDGRGLPEDRSGGQGLSIMRRRVSRLGGTLTLGNRPEGGAVVSVTIPPLA